MIHRLTLLLGLLLLLVGTPAYSLPPLQLYIELTPPGGTVNLPPGRYAGPAVINHPVILDGHGKVEVDGGGDGSVITIKADKTTVRGLHLTHSGGSHNTVDAGITIKANQAVVENNQLDDVLFGIHLSKSNDSIVRGNTISSLERDISLRGDGIRLWYSYDNLIENNHLTTVRDIVISNSSDNRIFGNTIEQSRIGMEFVFSHGNEVAHNTVTNNNTGIVVIYSNELEIHDNQISHISKTTGSGLSFKESAEVVISDNEIAHCAVGLLANSPLDPLNRMTASGNLFTYNVLGMYFYGEKGGHVLQDNRFENNFTDVLGSAASTVRHSQWDGNYWDQYQGFDQDGDGRGDQPYNVYLYSERIWNTRPMTQFYRGSPAMSLLDFAFRMAPFSSPDLVYSDPTPKIAKNTGK